ncbi:MAG: SDR family NAD(P)-dependent oxidoreductase [Spirochaetales bacterium]|nr:SDR family NAD(P)-dependent oxidoreductase [Spirochaetales bacterium]
MQISGNTMLITGGGSGIGLGLAREFQKLGNTVLIAGRSPAKLKEAELLGFKTYSVDMTKPTSREALAKSVLADYPGLNGVIHNAGIMKNENMLKGPTPEIRDETLATNLIGPMHLTELFLKHFLGKKNAFIMTVTSGLAFSPLAMTPTYSATKAAIHSYTQSLRYQLKDTGIQVLELVPPYVQTGLMGERQAKDPNAMPLEAFITEVMQILKNDTQVKEILVERVLPQRHSGDGGPEKHEQFFNQLNDRMLAARKAEW